ncbi:MAG: hypothetical protein O2931_06840 [Planctomycetota bacterium]|nr:hypothetical protein [Planctomycetota bacterium]MDA1178496.1 hypothetical protein [Planctomycetota bacterium]
MLRKILALVLVAISGSQSVSAAAEVPTLEISDVQWGLQGKIKLGAWTPMYVQVRTGKSLVRGELRVRVLDSDDMHVDYASSAPQEIQGESSQWLVQYVRFGRQNSTVQVEFAIENGSRVVWSNPNHRTARGIRASQPTIGIIGADPGFRQQLRLSDRRASERIELCPLDPTRQPLPEQWLGYDSLDVLVLSTDASAATRISPGAVAAIEQWIKLGGRLIWYGADGVTSLVEQNPGWRRLLPGDWNGVASVPKLSALEGHFGAKGPIAIGGTGVRVGNLDNPRGKVVVWEGIGRSQRPIWVQAPYGLGQITFLAMDMNRPPIQGWPGTAEFINRCIETSLGKEETGDASVRHGQASHLGYRDLTGQLRSALDQFDSVHIVPVLLAGVLALAYVGFVGPVDFLLVTHWLKRPTWTWITFPLIVIGFCSLTVWLNQLWKGTAWAVNEVHVVDIDQETGVTRGMSWMNAFSPRSEQTTIGLETPTSKPDAEVFDVVASWQGLSGEGFGGMDQSPQPLAMGDRYRHDVSLHARPEGSWISARLMDYPFHANSSHSFYGQWTGKRTTPQEDVLTADFDNLLNGSVVNQWGIELHEVWICHGRWVYPVSGMWVPGQKLEFQKLGSPRDLQALLTQRRFVTEAGRDARDIATPWNRVSATVPEIVRMMMFHRAAGGYTYTSLLHRQTAKLDLSDHLNLGRAIVFGRTKVPHVRWSMSGGNAAAPRIDGTTFFRIVLPVKLATPQRARALNYE